MKILALDTATEACSVALNLDGQQTGLFEVCPQQHSQRLLPMVDELMQQNEISVKALDYLCFGCGPGSFTGVRIATGMIQGLALGTGLPVVAVSTLAAMAQQAISDMGVNRVAVAIDARMGEVYFAQFSNHNSLAVLEGVEQVISPQQVLPLLSQTIDYFAGTGWQAYEVLSEASKGQSSFDILYPDARYMLPLAKLAIESQQTCAADDIQPVYLRDKVTWKKLPGR